MIVILTFDTTSLLYLWAEKHLIHNEKAEFKPEASVFADLITPVQRPPDSRPPAQRTE